MWRGTTNEESVMLDKNEIIDAVNQIAEDYPDCTDIKAQIHEYMSNLGTIKKSDDDVVAYDPVFDPRD